MLCSCSGKRKTPEAPTGAGAAETRESPEKSCYVRSPEAAPGGEQEEVAESQEGGRGNSKADGGAEERVGREAAPHGRSTENVCAGELGSQVPFR